MNYFIYKINSTVITKQKLIVDAQKTKRKREQKTEKGNRQ